MYPQTQSEQRSVWHDKIFPTFSIFLIDVNFPHISRPSGSVIQTNVHPVNNNNTLFTYAKHFPETPSSSVAAAQWMIVCAPSEAVFIRNHMNGANVRLTRVLCLNGMCRWISVRTTPGLTAFTVTPVSSHPQQQQQQDTFIMTPVTFTVTPVSSHPQQQQQQQDTFITTPVTFTVTPVSSHPQQQQQQQDTFIMTPVTFTVTPVSWHPQQQQQQQDTFITTPVTFTITPASVLTTTSYCSTDSKKPNRFCHLSNNVVNINCTLNIPYTLQLAGGCPPNMPLPERDLGSWLLWRTSSEKR